LAEEIWISLCLYDTVYFGARSPVSSVQCNVLVSIFATKDYWGNGNLCFVMSATVSNTRNVMKGDDSDGDDTELLLCRSPTGKNWIIEVLRKCCQERIIDVPHYTRFPYPRFCISAVVFHYYDEHRRSVFGNSRRCVESPVNCALFHDSSDHMWSVAFHFYPTLDIRSLFFPQKYSKYLAV
jgi:hypothetical protein